ncbi:unnamed protein product [Somion occarium]|uniref:Triosephosphate isomerase n=1 Tax=Somion occarium TaxID=3059160 RepID=A0ABP1DT66_9APHY
MPRQFFVGGNFKMNPITRESKLALAKTLNDAQIDPSVEVVIAPPAIYLLSLREVIRPDVKVAAQNAHYKPNGAFTGEISPAMLADAQIPYVILGHSERRTLFHETSDLVAQKTRAAIETGLSVILCVGETLAERESNKTTQVIEEQLKPVVDTLSEEQWSKIVVAYEPVWAIGTGKVATAAQAQETHAAIRAFLAKAVSPAVSENTRIIYGGSVTAANCKELCASLKPEFVDIINARKA